MHIDQVSRRLGPMLLGLGLLWMLVACGGGGTQALGAPSSPHVFSPIRQALPALSQDIEPSGARIDLRADHYFPSGAGDSWSYRNTTNGISTPGAWSRSINDVSGTGFTLRETEFYGGGSYYGLTQPYQRTAAGLVTSDVLGSSLAFTPPPLGDLLVYAEPFYALGSTRRLIRQGSWGYDFDGDGVVDSFRFEYSQTFVDQPTLTLLNGTTTPTAHFHNVAALTYVPSSQAVTPRVLTRTEDAWWAPGLGLVRAERSEDSTMFYGVIKAPYTLEIEGGVVNNQTLFQSASGGTGGTGGGTGGGAGGTGGVVATGSLIKLTLTHNGLVFDPTRGRYYASIPGSVIGQGNSLASIDASTGQISYSAPIGSEPGPMALSADGSVLYVGLNGSGDVLRLRLPDMQELGRTRLPVSPYFGQLYAETLSVSPIDASVVAVSMMRAGVSPRHGGVALIRADVLQPVMTQEHTGSNLIVFDAHGQYVYGYNNETTESGLRRIAVQVDGLVEQTVIAANAGFGTDAIDWSAQGIVLERSIYRAPDLVLQGTASTSVAGCRAHTVPNRLVCRYSANGYVSTTGQLAVVDASTFVINSAPVYQVSASTPDQIVPGPAGQVALRFGNTYVNSSATQLWLYNSTDLQ